MRLGLISDMHLGFTRGTRTIGEVNVREQDFIDAARDGVFNLLHAGRVDAIVDLGDMAEVAAPKKRAVLALIEMIRNSKVPWFSANGNHTQQRTRSDLHLYDVLGAMCSNFHGYTEPAYVEEINGILIPFASVEGILGGLSALQVRMADANFVGGHWSTTDVPYPGEHVPSDVLPVSCPTFLGHYHRRRLEGIEPPPSGLSVVQVSTGRNPLAPIYIGSTERSKWNEWDNPCGVAVYDTETKTLEFIDHPVRLWVDLHADTENYLEVIDRDLEGAIVRLTLDASREQYSNLDLVGLRKKARALDPLEFEVRRRAQRDPKDADSSVEVSFDLASDWRSQVDGARIAKGIKREAVYQIGADALAAAAGTAA